MPKNLLTVTVDDGSTVVVPITVPPSIVTVGAMAKAKERSPRRAKE
jgi:hypothetical protein